MLNQFTKSTWTDFPRQLSLSFLKSTFNLSNTYSSTLGEAFMALKSDCVTKSEASYKYYCAVRKEILNPLNAAIKEQETRLKEIWKVAKSNRKTFENKKTQLEEEHLKYAKAVKEVDECIAGYDSMKEKKDFTEDKKAKLTVKVNQALKDCKEAEKAYRGIVYATKEARADYIRATGLVLDMYQKEEEERVQTVKKTLLDMLEKEKQLNGLRGDKLEERVVAVEKIMKELEVEGVVKKLEPNGKGVEDITFKKVTSKFEGLLQKFDTYYTKGGPMTPFNFEAARLSLSTGIDEDVDEKTQETTNALRKILSHCWEAKGLSNSEKERFNDIVKDRSSRKLFCECLNQYRKQGIFSMSPKAFSYVAGLLYELMSHIEADADIDSALSVIILSQTFYCEQKNLDGNLDRIYLQQAISKHRYFHNEEFWAKALDVPLNKSGEAVEVENESEEEKAFREANEIFVKLGTYAHNMLQFELDKRVVEKIIFRYAESKGLSKQYVDAIQVLTIIIYQNISKQQRAQQAVYRKCRRRTRSYSRGSKRLNLQSRYVLMLLTFTSQKEEALTKSGSELLKISNLLEYTESVSTPGSESEAKTGQHLNIMINYLHIQAERGNYMGYTKQLFSYPLPLHRLRRIWSLVSANSTSPCLGLLLGASFCTLHCS
eukprot:TRINITY_DN1433_c0_g1_i1.p1 TRINITY_DN1433_c0_g1~~TRINITY_DN1433_c0_g1_i1.p1  ORF type:complete len:658 (+),score=76.04 TRINITY_DN1433_c0_g1_i1:2503-4476(+)